MPKHSQLINNYFSIIRKTSSTTEQPQTGLLQSTSHIENQGNKKPFSLYVAIEKNLSLSLTINTNEIMDNTPNIPCVFLSRELHPAYSL